MLLLILLLVFTAVTLVSYALFTRQRSELLPSEAYAPVRYEAAPAHTDTDLAGAYEWVRRFFKLGARRGPKRGGSIRSYSDGAGSTSQTVVLGDLCCVGNVAGAFVDHDLRVGHVAWEQSPCWRGTMTSVRP